MVAGQEVWVDMPPRRLFVKRRDYDVRTNNYETPFVLMHNSLGSVELWRHFS
jgi:hypothetical protein